MFLSVLFTNYYIPPRECASKKSLNEAQIFLTSLKFDSFTHVGNKLYFSKKTSPLDIKGSVPKLIFQHWNHQNSTYNYIA